MVAEANGGEALQRVRRGVVLLMGPTGVGKTDLAVTLAEEMPFEIISVDSALVFRGMDIGTAKPDAALRARIPHHLVDIRDAAENYSAGDFVRDAAVLIQDIWRRGRTPLLTGGTMLYFNALRQGIATLPEGDAATRAQINALAAAVGWPVVHRELAQVDPTAAARIHHNDAQRIQRALEVFRLTGERISELQLRKRSVLHDVAVHEIILSPDERVLLHNRLDVRFRAMLRAGLLEEVAGFYNRGDLSAEHTAMRAVGYRQLWRHLAGQCELAAATEQAIVATRQLAKRQMTWLRRYREAEVFDAMQFDVAVRVKNALLKRNFASLSSF